jgi:aminoglycoside phosphotransferase (APT) family kinase protein
MATIHHPTLDIPIQKLEDYARTTHQHLGRLERLAISPLDGGYVASGVYRLDLEFQTESQGNGALALVQKRTYANEVRVMRLLHQWFQTRELPTLVDFHIATDEPDTNGASWFITPFYEGRLLTFDDEVPASIVDAQARVHAHFLSPEHELDWLPQVNAQFVDNLIDHVLQCLEKEGERLPASLSVEVRSQLNDLRSSPVLAQALRQLPTTLTHGDVHPGNILHTVSDAYVLFDWGNARIAPAMLDLANMVSLGSPAWERYLETWERVTGAALADYLAHLGYHWATAIINIQYLPFAIGHRGSDDMHIQGMMGRLRQAVAKLEEMMSSP